MDSNGDKFYKISIICAGITVLSAFLTILSVFGSSSSRYGSMGAGIEFFLYGGPVFLTGMVSALLSKKDKLKVVGFNSIYLIGAVLILLFD